MVNPMGFFRFTVGNSWSDTQSLYVVLLNSIQKSYDSHSVVQSIRLHLRIMNYRRPFLYRFFQ